MLNILSILISSAKKKITYNSTKKNGPMTDPCGTPEVTSIHYSCLTLGNLVLGKFLNFHFSQRKTFRACAKRQEQALLKIFVFANLSLNVRSLENQRLKLVIA